MTTKTRQVLHEIIARRFKVNISRFNTVVPGSGTHTALNLINR